MGIQVSHFKFTYDEHILTLTSYPEVQNQFKNTLQNVQMELTISRQTCQSIQNAKDNHLILFSYLEQC